jgi:hypothetical protein
MACDHRAQISPLFRNRLMHSSAKQRDVPRIFGLHECIDLILGQFRKEYPRISLALSAPFR